MVVNVNVQSVQPPEQVQAAFEDTLKAGQDGDRLKNEGLAYASDVIPKAQGTAARLREEAEGYKSRVVAQAEGDAQRFNSVLTEYQKAPSVTRDRLYIDTMQQVYSNVSKVMVDSRGNSNLLYLPLDKLMQQAGAGVPTARRRCRPPPRPHPPPVPWTCARVTASVPVTATAAEPPGEQTHEPIGCDRRRRAGGADVAGLDAVRRRPAPGGRGLRAG